MSPTVTDRQKAMLEELTHTEARGHREDTPLSIAQLNWYVKNVLEQAIPSVWVEGEISDLSQPSSGHLYFTLKDDKSQVRAVIWRSAAARIPFKLKDGISIVCQGAVEVYPPRGSYQLIVNKLQPKGIGPLQLAFQQLHKRLAAQGLFEEERKRPLPRFPKRIGFVTSPSGAALHDFLEASKDLWNDYSLTVIPARVQGELAARDLVQGIRIAQDLEPKLDVLIVGRGGGSMEDLWCFNEESVVKAIAASHLPIVSAVGHEIDVTLSDLAADARALTPTHAAQLVLPNQTEIASRLRQLRHRLDGALRSRLEAISQRLESLANRSILARPHDIHLQRRQRLDETEMRARKAVWNFQSAKQEKLAGLARAAEALSPLNVLARGYSLTQSADAKSPIRSSNEVTVGDTIETILGSGKLISRVESCKP